MPSGLACLQEPHSTPTTPYRSARPCGVCVTVTHRTCLAERRYPMFNRLELLTLPCGGARRFVRGYVADHAHRAGVVLALALVAVTAVGGNGRAWSARSGFAPTRVLNLAPLTVDALAADGPRAAIASSGVVNVWDAHNRAASGRRRLRRLRRVVPNDRSSDCGVTCASRTRTTCMGAMSAQLGRATRTEDRFPNHRCTLCSELRRVCRWAWRPPRLQLVAEHSGSWCPERRAVAD